MLLKITTYQFQKPEEIFDIAEMLSNYFDNSKDVMIGIYELLFNALEHGNLGIGGSIKADLLRRGKWHDELQRRMLLPEHQDKYVKIEIIENEDFCKLIITDQGNGFDWRHYLRSWLYNGEPNGRGLVIAARCGFDEITFNEDGNSVSCVLNAESISINNRYNIEFKTCPVSILAYASCT